MGISESECHLDKILTGYSQSRTSESPANKRSMKHAPGRLGILSKILLLTAASLVSAQAEAAKATPPKPPTLHAKATAAELPMGPFIRLKSGEILTVDETSALISKDEGKTWESHAIFPAGQDFAIRRERVLLETRDGAIILAFMNDKERVWKWNKETSDADEGVKLPTYVVRSLDGGKTWQNLQKLHDEWTGAIRDIIQTKNGTIVFTSMMILHNPGHHATITYASKDDGVTWRRSNVIDLGGKGHHDGALEAAIEQLKDGRLWMLIRSNYGKFWEAFSEDDGVTWLVLQPSAIEASAAPALLKRVKSGKLILIWNRLLPEGATDYPKIGGDGQFSEHPVINHRDELSVAFSSDEGKTWSKPQVIATAPEGARRDVSYPFLFEVKPGEFWLTSMRGGLAAKFKEEDFLVK